MRERGAETLPLGCCGWALPLEGGWHVPLGVAVGSGWAYGAVSLTFALP